MRGSLILLTALMIGASAGERARRRRQQNDPAGAKFDHYQLHDGLQFSGSDLPIHLRGAFLSRAVVRRQHHGQWIVSE